MNVAWGFVIALLALVALGAAERLWRRARDAAEWRVRQAGDALAHADDLAVLGAWDDLAGIVERVGASLARDRRPWARLAEARSQLLLAELETVRGRLGEAAARLGVARAARAVAGAIPGAEALGARERYVEALLRHAGGDPGETAANAEQVFAEAEPAVLAPAMTLRLARFAIDRAQAEMGRGAWPDARAHLERAVRFGERLDPEADSAAIGETLERERLIAALARSRASFAAGEIGQVLDSLGRAAEAVEWLDRAVATLGDSEHATVRVARARALIVRAMHETPDDDPAGEKRAARLRRARDEATGLDWPAALGLAARAEIQLGVLSAAGGGIEAAAHFRAAADRLEGVDVAGAAEMAAEARMLLGHALEEQGGLDDARVEYRRAFDAGRADADVDARRLASVAACHLHRLLHVADRTDEARQLLESLEVVVPSLAPPVRPLLAAMAGRCRGQQCFRDGDPEGADAALEQALGLLGAGESPEARDLMRQLVADRGHLALARDAALESERHFRHVLTLPPGARPPAIDRAERAEWHLGLAQALARLERLGEAVPEWSRAFEEGRDSGRAAGRSAAAVAALHLGDDTDRSAEDRRRWYETAARLGRLSGTARGRQVAAAVEERLRELAD